MYNNNTNNESNNNLDILENNNKIYNYVFNNIYLKKIIFKHLNIFNILYSVNFIFKSIKEWRDYKYKEYLNRVTLGFKNNIFLKKSEKDHEDFDLNELPENIKHITIYPPSIISSQDYRDISVPNHIESVSYFSPIVPSYFKSHINYLQQSYSSKINTLVIHWRNSNEEILPPHVVIPESVTNLDIWVSRLSNNVFPPNLRKLRIRGLQSFEDGSFENGSLNEIEITISDLSLINKLSTISKPIKLNFFKKIDIDSNTQFPNNIQDLYIKGKSFNSKLPDSLKSIKLHLKNQQNPIQLPSTLEKINIVLENQLNQELFQNIQAVPPGLKSLKFQCSSITDSNGQSILPDKLMDLVIRGEFNKVLQVNQLPSSLTHLDLGSSFNQVIDVNILPENLNTLILGGYYSHVINPLSIPQQLKFLKIKNNNYPHLINLTSTHPYTIVDNANIKIYYDASSADFDKIRVLKLPAPLDLETFNLSLSSLKLQNKSNLEYLHLGLCFTQEIQLSDLPSPNNIKTLELCDFFQKTINLEHFQNLETLIVPFYSLPTITTSTIIVVNELNQKEIHYNFYKFKNIIVEPKQALFLKQLDINFYQFVKYKNNQTLTV